MIQPTYKLPSTQNTQLPMVLTTSTQDTEEKELSYFSSQLRTWALEGGRGREREGTGGVKQLILDMRKQASINRDYSLEQLRRGHNGWLVSYQSDRH